MKIKNIINLWRNSIAVILLANITVACTSSEKITSTPPPYLNIWKLENCLLKAGSGIFTLSTDGKMSGDNIYIKLTSSIPLASIPRVEFYELYDVIINVEGHGQFYSFELPYTPKIISQIIQPEKFVTIGYIIKGQKGEFKTTIPTAELPVGVAYMSRICGYMVN